MKFKEFFRKRDCETFVRPLDNEKELARIEQQRWESLRPAFRDSVNAFEKKVLGSIKTKTIGDKTLSGNMFLGIA